MEISCSHLGIGFEKLDRVAFHPEKVCDNLERIGAGNNPMVGMTIAIAVAIEEASK